MLQASGPSLVLQGDSHSSPGQSVDLRDERRKLRGVLKEAQRGLTDARSARLCMLPGGGEVVRVSVGALLVAHVSGVHRCGSPWSCPMCSPVVAEAKAADITEGVRAHLAVGGGVEFVTLTGAHRLGDRLAPLFGLCCRALGRLLTGRPWERLAEAFGYVGSIRVVEVTCRGPNGWHPHTHALMLFDQPLAAQQRRALRSHLFGRWQATLTRAGFGALHPVHGVDVELVGSVEDLGKYLTKSGSFANIGHEMARGDLKRWQGSPWSLLMDWALCGDLEARSLWSEYEAATFGRKFVQWSKGLRGRLGLDVEKTDEELAVLEGEDLALVEVMIGGDVWRQWVRAGEVGVLLRQIEEIAALFIILAGYSGTVRGLSDGEA